MHTATNSAHTCTKIQVHTYAHRAIHLHTHTCTCKHMCAHTHGTQTCIHTYTEPSQRRKFVRVEIVKSNCLKIARKMETSWTVLLGLSSLFPSSFILNLVEEKNTSDQAQAEIICVKGRQRGGKKRLLGCLHFIRSREKAGHTLSLSS